VSDCLGADVVTDPSASADVDVAVLLHRRDFSYEDLSLLCRLIAVQDVPYIVGNQDMIYPDESRLLPDTGAVAQLVKDVTSREPLRVCGKPFSGMLPSKIRSDSLGIMIGDQERTDGRLAEILQIPFFHVTTHNSLEMLANCAEAIRCGEE
jgi:ribonucleotide monophosphatase NagD (HAD superfamily)